MGGFADLKQVAWFPPGATGGEFVDFREVPIDGYFVDKQGRWRDKRNGRFVEMPKNSPLTRRVINEVNQSKILQLSGADAYNSTLKQLKEKYKDNPEALNNSRKSIKITQKP